MTSPRTNGTGTWKCLQKEKGEASTNYKPPIFGFQMLILGILDPEISPEIRQLGVKLLVGDAFARCMSPVTLQQDAPQKD